MDELVAPPFHVCGNRDAYYGFDCHYARSACFCGRIDAATGGAVSLSGVSGGFGNRIILDHGTAIESACVHIIDGGRLVSNRQTVTAGQLIARTGSIGGSTGCNLHSETRSGGAVFDPVPFMRQRGVTLG